MPVRRSALVLSMLALVPATALAHEGHEHFFGDADHVWPFVFAAAVIAISARIILKRRAASKARKDRD
jgi:peptidoglycan/LPS O-acetylase OafA/YrhL